MPYNNRPIAIVNKITELNWLKTRSAHQFISLGVKLNNRSKLRLWTWCKCSQMSPKSSGTVSGPIWTSRSWPRSTLGMKGLGLETCAWTSQSRPRNSCLRIVSDGWRTPRHPVVKVRGLGAQKAFLLLWFYNMAGLAIVILYVDIINVFLLTWPPQ